MKNKILILVVSFTFIFTCCFINVVAVSNNADFLPVSFYDIDEPGTTVEDTTVEDTTVDETTNTTTIYDSGDVDTDNNFTRLEHIVIFFGLLFFVMSFVNFNKGSVIDV